jgi:hypothetical protein
MKRPRIKVKSVSFGSGCLVQIIGIISLFLFFPFGIIIGIILLIIGSRLSFKFLCPQCNNKLDNNKVKLCPTCKTELDPPPWWSIPI